MALKLVKAELARDDVFRRRFEREAGAAARVAHPNVVPVVDRGEHEGMPYMAQKFIDAADRSTTGSSPRGRSPCRRPSSCARRWRMGSTRCTRTGSSTAT